MKKIMNKLEEIARKELVITLKERMSDRLDFYENNETSIQFGIFKKHFNLLMKKVKMTL